MDKKILVGLVATLLLCGSTLARARADETGVSPESFAKLTRAKNIYQDNCAVCHGFDGIPMVPEAANFSIGERLDKSDAELLGIIEKGKNNMPPWEEMLSEEERKEALFYVRLLIGDQPFQENCAACHDQSVPPLSNLIPKGEALASFEGTLDICRGSDVEAGMDQKELVNVIKFLRELLM